MSYILLYVFGMWMYGHVWAKINLICLPLLLSILFLKVSHWTMAFQFSKTSLPKNPEILVCLSKPWDYRCTPPYSASHMGARDPHSSPVQALYEPTHLPSIYVLPFRTLTIASYSVLLHLEYFASLQLTAIYSSQQSIFSFSISIVVSWLSKNEMLGASSWVKSLILLVQKHKFYTLHAKHIYSKCSQKFYSYGALIFILHFWSQLKTKHCIYFLITKTNWLANKKNEGS